MVKLANTTNLSFVDFGLEGSSPSLDNKGIQFKGKTTILHIVNSGSFPDFSIKAREAQLVEQNVEVRTSSELKQFNLNPEIN